MPIMLNFSISVIGDNGHYRAGGVVITESGNYAVCGTGRTPAEAAADAITGFAVETEGPDGCVFEHSPDQMPA